MYHNKDDCRRDCKHYQQIPCKNVFENGKFDSDAKCVNGDECGFSHNYYELRWHPKTFKKKPCLFQEAKQTSKFKDKLPFRVCPWINVNVEYFVNKDYFKKEKNISVDNENVNQLLVSCIDKVNYKKCIAKYKKGSQFENWVSGWDCCPHYHIIPQK